MFKRFALWTSLIGMVMVMAMAIAVAGCGAPQSSTLAPGDAASQAANPAPGQPVIALVMKSLANEFFLTMQKGAETHQAAHAGEYTLISEGTKDEEDVNRQVQLVEQMIGQKVNAIVIAPADSKALVAVCKKAMDAGIQVVNIDNRFDEAVLAEKDVKIPFVGPDNCKGAKLVGDFLAKKLTAGDPVAIIEGIPTAYNAIQRKQGFEEAMNAAGMKIVASQSASWDMAKANSVVAALITSNPDMKAVLCSNDSMALGAVSALRSAGKLDQVKVVGFDNISAVQELLKKGEIQATADQHADQLAVFGIEYALEMLAGKAAPENRETPVDLITAESLQK